MKIRYPRASVAILAAALLAGTSVVTAYAVTESAAPSADTAATENGSTWWKAEISDYDSSLSLVQYEEIKPSQAQIDAMEQATTPAKQAGKVAGSGETLGSSSVTGSATSAQLPRWHRLWKPDSLHLQLMDTGTASA